MDEFGYLAVILSIILGLSVTQLLQGLSNVINARDRVRIYWPAIGWALLLLVIDVQAWWALFGLRHRHAWTFLQFAVLLLETIMLYLLAALALPGTFGEGTVDLRANYFRHARWFFGSFVTVLLVSIMKSVVIDGSLPGPFDLGFHLFGSQEPLPQQQRGATCFTKCSFASPVSRSSCTSVHSSPSSIERRRPLLRGRRSEDRGQRSEDRGISPSIGLGSTAACALCTIVTAPISTIPAMTWCQCKAAWKNPQVMHTAASVCIISK